MFKAYYCIDRMGSVWQAAYVSFNLRFHRFGKFIGRAFKTARHVTLANVRVQDMLSPCTRCLSTKLTSYILNTGTFAGSFGSRLGRV